MEDPLFVLFCLLSKFKEVIAKDKYQTETEWYSIGLDHLHDATSFKVYVGQSVVSCICDVAYS